MELTSLFYLVDEFCKGFEPEWRQHLLDSGETKRFRRTRLTLSEVLTIVIHFHQSNHRTFKHYYQEYVSVHLRSEFPELVSYSRFVELTQAAAIPLLVLLTSLLGTPTPANFIDSTTLKVCHNRRIRRHRVFKGIAARGKTSMGWFYGLKLHLIVNEKGEIVSFLLSPGNMPDNNVAAVTKLAARLTGKLYGDRGYISHDLFLALFRKGVRLITGIKKNMKNMLLPLWDKLMLRKRCIIETINDQCKNQEQIEHTRHRSPKNFVSNLLAGLIAYQLKPKKPCLHYATQEQRLLMQPQLLLAA